MACELSVSEVAKHIGDLIAWFAPEGLLRDAVLVIYSLCGALVLVVYRYYLGLLAQGAAPEGSQERKDYDALRASLAGGNLAARLYAKWLTTFLDGVERFFGDAGTEGQRAFGLKTPAPLWTAPALDRCLLLALIYPIATIFLIWAVSGDVGPAERALGLKPDNSGWGRSLWVGAFGLMCFAAWHGARAWSRRSLGLFGSLAMSPSLLLPSPLSLSLTLSLSPPLLAVSLSLSAPQSLPLALTLALMFRVLALAFALSLWLALLLVLSLSLALAPPLTLVPSVLLSLWLALWL